jgi:hypothetical protein
LERHGPREQLQSADAERAPVVRTVTHESFPSAAQICLRVLLKQMSGELNNATGHHPSVETRLDP